MNRTYVKKPLAITVILLFFSVSVIPSTGTTDVKQITMPISNGNTFYVGGSGPNNYTKIQDAINDSSDGDTVYVYDDSSPYYENLNVSKSINLIGEDRNTTIIDGYEIDYVLEITHYRVVVSRFSIRNGYCGIRLQTIQNVEIHHVNIYDNRFHGIFISDNASNVVIHHSILYNNGWNGVFISRCENQSYNMVIQDNIIENNGCGKTFDGGILLQDCYNCVDIRHNNITTNNMHGIYLLRSYNNRIINNNFIDNEKDAFFSDSFLNRWKQNYWNRPRILPKPIFGEIEIFYRFWIPWFNFDWHPAQEPYDIGV